MIAQLWTLKHHAKRLQAFLEATVDATVDEVFDNMNRAHSWEVVLSNRAFYASFGRPPLLRTLPKTTIRPFRRAPT